MTMGIDADHAVVHGAGQPRGPAAFRAAGDDEAIHLLNGPPVFRRHVCGDRIHRSHRALDHGVARCPPGLSRRDVLVPRIADQIVFAAWHAVAVERERLVRHHAEFRHHRLRCRGDGGHACAGAGGRFSAVASAADEQHGRVRSHGGGDGERQPMPPLGTWSTSALGQPVLGDHVDDDGPRAVLCFNGG